jgi:hypothetical protein
MGCIKQLFSLEGTILYSQRSSKPLISGVFQIPTTVHVYVELHWEKCADSTPVPHISQ